jgi:hypothetical protein
VAAFPRQHPHGSSQSYIDRSVLARFTDGLVISLDGLPADAWRAGALIERPVLAMLADNG